MYTLPWILACIVLMLSRTVQDCFGWPEFGSKASDALNVAGIIASLGTILSIAVWVSYL
jgi:hypothetical protein